MDAQYTIPENLISERPFKEGEPFYLIGNWLPVYSFTIVLGMIASILTIFFFWKREKYKIDHLLTLIIITIPSSIIGARLGFIFERLAANDSTIAQNWWNIREGGLSIQWAVILPTIFNLLYAYRKRIDIDYRKAFSFILPAVLIGQAIGRWGNFTNHEVYGKVDYTGQYVDWLGYWIRRNMFISDSVEPNGALRVPLFFYEFLTSLFGYILIVWVLNLFGWLKPGSTGALYIMYYGIVRTSMENLRQEAFAIYFVLAILSIILGLILLLRFELFTNYYIKIGKEVNKEHKKIFSLGQYIHIVKFLRYQKSKEKFFNIPFIRWNRVATINRLNAQSKQELN
ncbi:prolipoprotein diacylglyceryl transferase [Mesomycoplasma hyorhinis]|uniref:prolipoprotein diacylglyceryl transferase n=1 Tax=Mesomycoplasma hyorhinis TaxID=2100 RepID=UPI00037D066D|nr:prolipoprotein diacylglyceryl transferase [Mesomycoplasma hyorhinis]QPC29412.1 prolipoprotein diacylglyceryl transferase [Mesomycoplasma hyorhinis]